MDKKFDGVNIVVNYTSDVIDILLKDIPQVPVTLEKPYFTSGSVSPRFHVPFTFPGDAHSRYSLDSVYDSKKGEFVLSSSIVHRFLRMYDICELEWLEGHKALIKTECLCDSVLKESSMMLYSISRPSFTLSNADAGKNTSQIINPDGRHIALLFRDISVFPASVSYAPDPKIKPNSIDFTIYFEFYDDIKQGFRGKEYHMNMNTLAINKLMVLLGADSTDDCVGKDIAVYVHQEPQLRKLWICGLTSMDQYYMNSVQFENFKRTR